MTSVLAQNRRIRHDYEIVDTVEAGIILSGAEVKSCRNGGCNLSGAYVSFLGGQATLKNTTIAPYRFSAPDESYKPGRERQLLLKKREITKLQAACDEKGVSILPLEVRGGRHIKVVLGVGRGRKKHDKRQQKKERDIEKKMRQGKEY